MKFLFALICAMFIIQINAEESFVEKIEWISSEIDNFDCHSSSIVETMPGEYCVVWKGGPGKGQSNVDIHGNVGIWISTFNGAWSVPTEVVSAPESIC